MFQPGFYTLFLRKYNLNNSSVDNIIYNRKRAAPVKMQPFVWHKPKIEKRRQGRKEKLLLCSLNSTHIAALRRSSASASTARGVPTFRRMKPAPQLGDVPTPNIAPSLRASRAFFTKSS